MEKEKLKALLLESIERVFSTSFYAVVEPVVDEPPQIIGPEGGRVFHAEVRLKKEGLDRFKVDFYFMPSFLCRVTKDFLGLSDDEEPSEKDMLDMAREIANMVGGEVASLASLEGEEWDISLPVADVLGDSIPVESGVYMGFADVEGGVFHVVVGVI